MKIKSLKFRIILSAVNILCVAGALIVSSISDNYVNSLTSQKGAELWQNNSDTEYSQISCFFADDSGADTNNINGLRSAIKSGLTSASVKEEENKRMWIDAYTSSMGKMEVSGTKRGSAKTEITAVTGDFFLIHDFNFVDGSYFRDDDIDENGIVIDRMLAWQIFGSDEIKGMTAEISGKEFYVAGIVDIPQSDAEKKTYGNFPRAYISYSSAKELVSEKGENPAVQSYEAVIPNPVKSCAYNTVSEFIEKQYPNTAVTVENSGRFSLSSDFKRLKNLSKSVIIKNSVSYPWWENSARYAEMKASLYLFRILVLLVIPLLTLVLILIKFIRYMISKKPLERLVQKIKNKIPY